MCKVEHQLFWSWRITFDNVTWCVRGRVEEGELYSLHGKDYYWGCCARCAWPLQEMDIDVLQFWREDQLLASLPRVVNVLANVSIGRVNNLEDEFDRPVADSCTPWQAQPVYWNPSPPWPPKPQHCKYHDLPQQPQTRQSLKSPASVRRSSLLDWKKDRNWTEPNCKRPDHWLRLHKFWIFSVASCDVCQKIEKPKKTGLDRLQPVFRPVTCWTLLTHIFP